MGRISQALLGHLHGVFSPDPEAVLALRVRHPESASWTLEGDILTLQAGDAPSVWDLNAYSLGTLAAALTAAGFEVVYLNPAISHLSALTLLEGSGDQGDSNGDHLTIYTAPLAVLLAALGQALGEGQAAIAAALAQMILPNATHEWADLFGEIFGIPRQGAVQDSPYVDLARFITRYNPIGTTGHEWTLNAAWEQFFSNLLGVVRQPGESAQHFQDRLVYDAQQRPALTLPPLEADAAYTARMIEEVKRSRASPAAILRNIRRLTGHDLALREPWKEVAYLSQSALSGQDHLQGAPIYEYHRMQLVAQRGIAWTPVIREAEADRPAGTLMLPPATHMPPLFLDGIPLSPDLGRVLVWAEELKWNAYGRLSVDLDLSNYLPPPPTDFGEVHVKGLWTQAGLRGPYDYFANEGRSWDSFWDGRTWATLLVRTQELYPPKDILSSTYEGVFRLSVSPFGINDRLQYETGEWDFALTQLSAGALAEEVTVAPARLDAQAQALPYSTFGLLSRDLALSASQAGPVQGFKIITLES